MPCYRFVTPVIRGKWRSSEGEALADALVAGQAYLHRGRVIPLGFVEIEELPKDRCPDC